MIKPKDAFDIVLNTELNSNRVCIRKPVGVKDAAVFLVDTTKLRHRDDLKADDMGTWVHKGKPIRYFLVNRSETGAVRDVECTTKRPKAYKLTRIYYHHKGTSEFRKTIFYVHGMLRIILCVLLLLCVLLPCKAGFTIYACNIMQLFIPPHFDHHVLTAALCNIVNQALNCVSVGLLHLLISLTPACYIIISTLSINIGSALIINVFFFRL